MNQIEVMVTEPNGAVSSLYSNDIFFARGVGSSDDKYLLHVLSIAAKDYDAPADLGDRGGFTKLQFPIDDVVAVTNALTESFEEGKSFYRMGLSRRLTEKEITKASVEKAIGEINSSIRSTTDGTQHLLLVNISGHGKSVDGQFYFLPPTIGVNDPDLIKKQGIPWTTFAKAGEVKCRVVFLIDACESGVVVDFKSEVRDPRRSQAIVLAATKGETVAREYGELKHGLFTFSVLEGLAGIADEAEKSSVANADGKVDIFELGKYSQDRTLFLSSGAQIPSLAPKRLADTVYLPLIEK